MSTKTSIKRVALVAVSALGFGLLSMVPARAAITTIALTTTVADGVINVNAAYDDDADIADVYIEVLQSPDATIPVGFSTNEDVAGIVNETEGVDETDFEFAEIDTVGTYRFRVFVDQDADASFTSGVDIPAAVSTKVVVAGDLAPAAVGVLESLSVVATDAADYTNAAGDTFVWWNPLADTTVTIERDPAASTEGDELIVRVTSSADADVIATGYYDLTAGGDADTLIDTEDNAKSGEAGEDLQLDLTFGTAGAYSITVFADADADGKQDSSEIKVSFTVIAVTHDDAEIGDTAAFAQKEAMYIKRSNTAQDLVTPPNPASEDDVMLNVVRGEEQGLDDGEIKLLVLSSPDADLKSGTVLSSSDTTGRIYLVGDDEVTGRNFILIGTANGGLVDAAGTYSFRAFQDEDEDGRYDSGELSSTISYVLGGAAATTATALSSSMLNKDSGDTEVTVIVSVSDADGNPYAAIAEADIDLTVSPVSAGSFGAADQIGTTNRYRATFTKDGNYTTAGVVTITASFDPDVTTDNSTATLTLITVTNATELFHTGAAGVKTGTSLKLAAGGSDTMTVDIANTTINFTGKATTAGTYVEIIGDVSEGMDSSAFNRFGTTYVKSLADGTFAFASTLTGAAAGDSYTLNVGGIEYTVTYAKPAPALTIAPVASGGTVKAKYGDSLSVQVSLLDQWLRPYSDKQVAVSIPSTSRNPLTATKTTDANGIFTHTFTDTFVGATKTSDVVTFTYSYLATAAATTATNLTASFTISYTATGPAVGSIAVTSTAGPVTIDQVEAVAGAPVGSRITYTATVKDANGASAGSGILVTFTGGADDKFFRGVATGITNADGVATASVYRQKSGFASISASAGGTTGSALPVRWVNGAGTQRTVTLTTDPASTISGGTVTVKATVTDRWGNPVEGVEVTFAETGAGRLISTSALTNSAGLAQVDFTSNAGEVGTNAITATISGGQTLDLAGYVSTVAVAGVAAGVRTASVNLTIAADTSVSTADALLELAKAIGTGKEVEAAADAAAEAIDAANAATDAANLAAEAADAATVAAEEARDAADAATAAVEELATQVATLMSALKAQLTTLANTVAKIAKKVKA